MRSGGVSRRVPPRSPVTVDGDETAEKERGTAPNTEPPSWKHGSLRSCWLNWASRGTAVNTGFDVGINFYLSIQFA